LCERELASYPSDWPARKLRRAWEVPSTAAWRRPLNGKRFGTSRKALAEIEGCPVLWHIQLVDTSKRRRRRDSGGSSTAPAAREFGGDLPGRSKRFGSYAPFYSGGIAFLPTRIRGSSPVAAGRSGREWPKLRSRAASSSCVYRQRPPVRQGSQGSRRRHWSARLRACPTILRA
jgi:hypothetical protein